MVRNIVFSQAVEGFMLEKRAQRLSSRTLTDDYANAFRKFATFLNDDPPIRDITPDQVRHFLLELSTVARPPGGVARRPPKPLSGKSVLNVHAALSSLWSWAAANWRL
jgi:hypothetical protein